MNLDITNYGHFRLTSHGGRSYELFNRQTDDVWTINEGDYIFIKLEPDHFDACKVIDREYRIRRAANRLDVA
jgi:hypothetical protein